MVSIRLLFPKLIFLIFLLVPQFVAAQFVLSGDDIIFHRKGPDTLSRYGWRNVTGLGDLNSDGYADFGFTSFRPYTTNHSLLFYGGSPPDTQPDYVLPGNVWGAIDLTGDSISEVVTSSFEGYFTGERATVYFFRGYGDSIASVPYDSLFSPDSNAGNGQVVRLGDIDKDGYGDLVVCQPERLEGPSLRYYRGGPAFDTIPEWRFDISNTTHYLGGQGDNFLLMDWNGDGWLDIVVGWLKRHQAGSYDNYIAVHYGPDFSSAPDRTIWAPADGTGHPSDVFASSTTIGLNTVGDIDGDSYDDLGVLDGDRYIIYQGGPAADTLYDYRLDVRAQLGAAAGDLNHDGWNDLVLGQSSRGGEYGGLEIYLGGPVWDTVSDAHLLRPDLPPYLLLQIGIRVAAADDVNGDGFDDIIFASDNFSNMDEGDVFVVKGGHGIILDVDEHSVLIPVTGLAIYPNPSNPSCAIEFSLTTNTNVTIEIVNILGQTVRTLTRHQPFISGTNRVTWDGRTETGGSAPSGVYLVRLSTLDSSLSTKMLLIR